ncbi:acetate/propionate family kinase [Actinokineospora enzanensis]|uniref:acetate/propionate family kinase n=1 Tax=Actinokineospora enzanensis TaxID=155975 RepID=UPI0003792ED3|nr:acetate/propionate family kinase [Actinokineospora enzanensis]
MRVLVVNAGSSSLRLRLLGPDDTVERTADIGPHDIAATLADWPAPDAVGHRVVHGGTQFTEPVVVDARVRAALADLTELAPLHQPKSLAGLDTVSALLDVPAVACFDTAFHTTIPAAAATYAIPREWRERYAIRRYGFHGLSHAYCSARVGELLGRSDARVITCHLGAGASVAAVVGGRSVDTTMGFTPLEGLVMATRSGSVDPGLVLWLAERMPVDELTKALEERSGLLGLAGTADLREADAAAVEVYIHRLVQGIASMAASAGGLDALAFTGGVGENSATVRARAAERLGFLGVAVSSPLNAAGAEEITGASSVRVFVVPAREDLEIARGTRSALAMLGGT